MSRVIHQRVSVGVAIKELGFSCAESGMERKVRASWISPNASVPYLNTRTAHVVPRPISRASPKTSF